MKMKKIIFMLPVLCLMFILCPQTVSAAGTIIVNGSELNDANGFSVSCGAGNASYEQTGKVLTLTNATIDSPSSNGWGIEITEEGVTVRLEGQNEIKTSKGLCSVKPIAIQGDDNSKLTIETSGTGGYGVHVTGGGLLAENVNLVFQCTSTSGYSEAAIDIRGNDNKIKNSNIEITIEPEDTAVIDAGIDATDASSLLIEDSNITMHKVGMGIACGSNVNINRSQFIIKESNGKGSGIYSVRDLIINDSTVNVNATNNWPALNADGKIVISGSRVTAESAGSNGIWCAGTGIEILAASSVKAQGYYPAIDTNGSITVKASEVEAENTAGDGTNQPGVLCRGEKLEIAGSTVRTKGDYGLVGVGDIVIKDKSVVKAEGIENSGIYSEGGNLEIADSELEASSQIRSGFDVYGGITMTDSKTIIHKERNEINENSIFAGGNISINGGTTEIGNGDVVGGDKVVIAGVITSNGKPSYENIKSNYTTGEVILPDADYSAVEAVIEEAGKLNKEDYTNFEIVEEAVAAVVEGKDIRYQAEVDSYAEAIRDAIAKLEKKPEKPEEPEEPEKPDNPEKPGKPGTPGNPETPQNPMPKTDNVKNAAALSSKAKVTAAGGKLKITWGKVSEADGYNIYAAKCGDKMKHVKTVKDNTKSSYTISGIGKNKIDKKANYKVQVRAYRTVNGKKKLLAKSMTYHIAGEAQKSYTNAKALKIAKKKIALKKGASKKITVKVIKQNSRKKLLSKKHVAPCRYYSSDKSIAAVSGNGVVKGRKKGTCTIYAVAANGVKKGVKVTVR